MSAPASAKRRTNFAPGEKGEIEEVVEDEDLAVAVGACADADDGDAGGCGDARGDLPGDAFKDECDGSRAFDGGCVCEERFDGGDAAALDLVTAHAVEGLGGEADVADDGDFGAGELFYEGCAGCAAFDLDGFGSGFLDEADGVGDGGFGGGVIAAEGHVDDEEGVADCAADCAGVMEHLVHGDGEGGVVAEGDHGEGVADEDEVDACFVDESRGGVVVCGEGGDGLVRALAVEEGLRGDFLRGGFTRGGTRLGDAHLLFSSALPF